MNGLMMDYPLTVTSIFRRGETLFGRRDVVSRLPDRSIHRYGYDAFAERTRRLITVLREIGVRPGDRVATLAWNHYQHLEAYYAVPVMGAVLHTLNLRLSPDEIAYVVNHAEDRAVIVDASLLPLWEKVQPHVKVKRVIVIGGDGTSPGAIDYEAVVTAAAPTATLPSYDERSAAAMCYTTGTTGRPKGVLYSHRSLVLHSIGISLPDVLSISEQDVVLPIVPMFHANAWGTPFACVMTGASLVLPGPCLDPTSLLELFAAERVTIGAGVPTIWMSVLQALEAAPDRFDLSALRSLLVGGSAPPPALMRAFDRRGVTILHAWGMTETSPLGTMPRVPPDLAHAPEQTQFAVRTKQGRPAPLVELRVRSMDEEVPWDGATMGELEVRGAWVASAYYNDAQATKERFTEDGWFRTGDIVTMDPRGTIQIQDRTKDLIKSGGEWISSVALESALMGHAAVAEAAVVAVPHEKWIERPLAAVVLKPNATATGAELLEFLAGQFPKFWVPDAVVFLEALPRTSAGKFRKSALRDQFKDYRV